MTSAEGSERDVAVSNSAFAAAAIVSSATRDASGPGAGRGGNAPRRETRAAAPSRRARDERLGPARRSFLPSRTAPSSPSSSSSSSHSSQTRSARSPAIASTASETRARSPTRTGSNQPGRPPAAETVPTRRSPLWAFGAASSRARSARPPTFYETHPRILARARRTRRARRSRRAWLSSE